MTSRAFRLPEALRSLFRSVPAVVRRDYVSSTAIHWLTLASGLLLFHLVARRAGPAGFAYYQVARGVVATLQPFALLGLVPALHRYLPRAGEGARMLARQSFLTQLILMDLIGLLGLVVADDLGRLLGIPGGATSVRAVIILLAGNCLCVIAVAALRGCGQITAANLSWLLGLGILPVVAFALTDRMELFLALQGIAMIIIAVAAIAVAGTSPAHETRPPTFRTVVTFGLRRAPGDIALPALFSFPTFYAAAAAAPGDPDAGYVGFVTSAITLICALFGMLTPVLLPRLSGAFHTTGVGAELGRGLKTLPVVAAALTIPVTGLLFLAAPTIVHNFLGLDFTEAIHALRLGLPAAIPFAVFYAARPTLDALADSPVVSRLLLGCLALQIVATLALGSLLPPSTAALGGLSIGAMALGVLSYIALLHTIPTPRIHG
ncbi:lipopolysaccharide biosynthesis protein [Actinoplanes sp. NPDC000266]